jgi:hypothetical protein
MDALNDAAYAHMLQARPPSRLGYLRGCASHA